MTESYKFKSKIATAIGAICTIITVLGIPQLTQIFPGYGQYIPAIVALATWYLSQTTENKRVEVAEKLAIIKYEAENNATVDPSLNYPNIETNDPSDEDGA